MIAVGGNPVAVAVDQATHTAYVGNGNDGTVSVINTATCNASVTTGCGQTPPTVTLSPATPPGPVGAAVDQATDTIYVVNAGGDTVSVIDGNTCNATVTSGCTNIPPTITVGSGPDGVAVDQATNTVYVANVNDNTVSVINGKTCDATVTTGCDQTPPTVAVGVQPSVPAVDQATDTVYVPNSNPGGAATVSVINGKTCNATVTTGCSQTPPTVAVGFNTTPFAAAVDQATDTVYTIAYGPSLGSVYVINGATCNATVTSGCGQAPPTVTVGSDPIGVAVDPVTNIVFVLNEEDSTMSVINGATCNAAVTSGCGHTPPDVATGFNPGYLDIDLATDTVYVSNQNENTVSVINGGACTPTHKSGCRHAAPTTTVGNAPQGIAVNQATGTVYVGNRSDNDLSVINGATCNAAMRSGCGRIWPTVATGPTPQALAVDQRTDTIYTANSDPNNGFAGTTVSVIDGATCNAYTTSGCGLAPATVSVGNGPGALAVNQSTDTIYVANLLDNTVSVIDGATCNAAVTTGCGQTPLTVTVGNEPYGMALDQATSTIYVANTGDNTVSVINIATCNAAVTTGCGQTPPTMATEGWPFGVAVDQATDTVYVDSIIGSSTDVFNGATCNANVTTGCGQTPVSVPMGGWPSNVAVNPATGTVYVPDNVDGEVSYFGNPTP